MPPEYATAQQVADYFGVNRATIWRWCQNGFPRPVPMPRGVTRFKWSDIRAWEEQAAAKVGAA